MKIPVISSIILLRNIIKLIVAHSDAKKKYSDGGKTITKYERKLIRDSAENTLESIITLIKGVK